MQLNSFFYSQTKTKLFWPFRFIYLFFLFDIYLLMWKNKSIICLRISGHRSIGKHVVKSFLFILRINTPIQFNQTRPSHRFLYFSCFIIVEVNDKGEFQSIWKNWNTKWRQKKQTELGIECYDDRVYIWYIVYLQIQCDSLLV